MRKSNIKLGRPTGGAVITIVAILYCIVMGGLIIHDCSTVTPKERKEKAHEKVVEARKTAHMRASWHIPGTKLLDHSRILLGPEWRKYQDIHEDLDDYCEHYISQDWSADTEHVDSMPNGYLVIQCYLPL